MKLLSLIFLLQLSFSAFAQDCANSTDSLRALVGNSDLPLTWLENAKKNQLTLKLKNSNGVLDLNLTTAKGNWAHVTGVICKVGENSFVARVSNMTWGPAAPGMVKMMGKLKELKLRLPYQSLLRVTAKGFSFEFSPL